MRRNGNTVDILKDFIRAYREKIRPAFEERDFRDRNGVLNPALRLAVSDVSRYSQEVDSSQLPASVYSVYSHLVHGVVHIYDLGTEIGSDSDLGDRVGDACIEGGMKLMDFRFKMLEDALGKMDPVPA